jgi:O-antigen/teichoic acid export membrane protein
MIFKNIGILGFGKLTRVILQIISLGFLSRILTKEDFGITGISLSLIGFFKLFAEVGLGQSIVRSKSIQNTEINSLIFFSIFIGIGCSALILASSGLISQLTKIPEIEIVLMMLTPLIIIESIKSILQGLHQRNMMFKKIVFPQLSAYILGYIPISFYLATNQYGYYSVIYGVLVSATLELILLLFNSSNNFNFSFNLKLKHITKHFSFSFYLTLNRFINYASSNFDNLLLGTLLGKGALGLYTRAYLVVTHPTDVVGQSIQSVLFSKLSKKKDEYRFKEYESFLYLTLYASVLISFLIILFSDLIVGIILGENWDHVKSLVCILAVGIPARTISKIGDAHQKSIGNSKELFYISIILLISVISVIYILYNQGLYQVCFGLSLVFIFTSILKDILVRSSETFNLKDILSFYFIYFIFCIILYLFTLSTDIKPIFYYSLATIFFLSISYLLFKRINKIPHEY